MTGTPNSFFGFFDTADPPGGDDDYAAIRDYGLALHSGRGPDIAVPGTPALGAAWALQTLRSDNIVLAVCGAPAWRGVNAVSVISCLIGLNHRKLPPTRRRVSECTRRAVRTRVIRRYIAPCRFGRRPNGYRATDLRFKDGVVVFGSSAEAVARCPGISPRIDKQALFDYLVMHMVPAPATIFVAVRKLRPATSAVVEKGKLRIERYWKPRFDERPSRSFSDLKEELFDALRTAVRDSSPDDATGAFLSGGLDSSTVAGILSEVGSKPAKTFSIGFGYADYDELSYARIANDRFGCTGHEYTIKGDDIVESFSRIAQAYDEPFGNSSALPAYYCARLAKQHGVQHLLAGDGGDELFAGNSRYAEQQVFEHYGRVPRLIRNGLIEPACDALAAATRLLA